MLLIQGCEIRRVGYTDRASAPLAMRSAGPRAADRPTIRACARVACVCRGFCARKAGLVHQVARAGAAGNRAIFWPRLGIILPRLRQKASLAGRTSGPFAIAAHLVGRHAHSFKHPPCSLLACSCRGFIFAPAHATDAHAAAAAADDNHRSRQPSRPHGRAQPPPSLPFGGDDLQSCRQCGDGTGNAPSRAQAPMAANCYGARRRLEIVRFRDGKNGAKRTLAPSPKNARKKKHWPTCPRTGRLPSCGGVGSRGAVLG